MLVNRQTTAIVVDSTADLPDYLAGDPNITMVPLTVYFGDEAFLDWAEMQPAEFYERLAAAPALPRTSQPSAGAFLDEYKRLRQRYERVYSVHLSGKFSGTIASAEVARSQIDGVKVVDSLLATGGIALLVDRILARVDQGVTEEELDAYIEHFLAKRTFTFLPTTLDQLHKGGRIGHASHLVGTLLNIKPVLTIEDGVIEVYKKVRGTRQALEAMVACMLESTEPGSTCYVSISHGLNEPLLEQMRGLLAQVTDRDLQIRLTSIVGAVIGTYVGPGALALCCIQE
ncbi:MAG: DegV family protein [Thermoleophilia bacterium]|nr:DegV family protein [Thermoleophilia bacterium]